MLENIFKKHLKKEKGSNRSNIRRSNEALLRRLAICFKTFIEYNVGVDYYTPIFGNHFNIENKVRSKTLAILKQEKLIEVKTNEQGHQSWQSCWKYNKETKRKEFDPTVIATPKSYCFTELGWSLVHNQKFLEEIEQLTSTTKKTTKYQSPQEIVDEMLKKAAEDNLSLKFKLSKPIDVVVAEYLEVAKLDWHVTEKNFKYKFKEARQVVLNTIHNFNNKLLKVEQRMYTALSLCPEELRKYILTQDGQQIEDGFDINSSIYTLLGATLEYYMKKNNIQIPAKFYEEKNKLFKLCFAEEHIYSYIGKWNKGHWTREQIKPHNMQVIFSNNEDIQKKDVNNTARNQIKNFMQAEFPTIWNILTHFEQEVNEDYEQELEQYNKYCDQMKFYKIKKQDWIAAGKIDELKPFKPKHVNKPKQIKSSIWRYFQTIETHIMLQLKHQLETEFNTTAYWIHDCLCFNKQLVTDKLKTQIQTIFKQSIVQLNLNQIVSINYLMVSKESKELSLPYGGSGIIELVEDQIDIESIDDERVIGEEKVEKIIEKSEFEILMDEINNKIKTKQKGF